MGSAQTTMARHSDEVSLIQTDLVRLESELVVAYAEKKTKEATLSAVEQTYFKARNEIQELENKQRDNFSQQQDLQGAVNRLKEKFSDVKFEITSIGERLRVEFGLGVNDVINNEPNPLFQLANLEKDVE